MGKKTKITKTKNAKAIAKTMSIQANNETEEIRVHRPFFKKLYTIEDIKTKKIAVHLPTQEEWDKAMLFFERNSVKWLDGRYPTNMDFWHKLKEKTVVKFFDRSSIQYDDIEIKNDGYTIITLDQIGLEPTAEEPPKEFAKALLKSITPETKKQVNKINEMCGMKKMFDKPTAEDKNDYSILERCDGDLGYAEEEREVNIDLCFGLDRQITIKDGHRKLLITEDSFDEMYEYLDNNAYGYPKGSRAWALLALDRGEKICHETWKGDGAYITYRNNYLVDEKNEEIQGYLFYKDGWEIYKAVEEPKKKTIREKIANKEDFSLYGIEYLYSVHYNGYEEVGSNGAIDLTDIIEHLDKIIKE